ncbi:MAG: GntR family transcriptional regulator [Thermus sp.]|nr:GntR family transcriptional regulator [Thermus sp.]
MPLYLDLARRLREGILKGVYGEALPPERALAEAFGASRDSVRKALDLLEEEGLVVRRRGSGTFVARRATFHTRLRGFSEEMEALGLKPSTQVLRWERRAATPEEALTLGLSPGEEVVGLVRLRLAEGEPMALERATLPAGALEEVPRESHYRALEAKGLRPVRALQRLQAVAAREEARPLGVEPGSPLLHLERVSYLADGRPIEWVKSWYRADRYELLVELV